VWPIGAPFWHAVLAPFGAGAEQLLHRSTIHDSLHATPLLAVAQKGLVTSVPFDVRTGR
jgi:hypothetical protein